MSGGKLEKMIERQPILGRFRYLNPIVLGMDGNPLPSGIARTLESPGGQRVLRWARRIFVTAMLAFLAYKIHQIGWVKICCSLPTTPLFYLLFLVAYPILPLAEALIYSVCWGFKWRQALIVFFKKNVYNQDVLDYSGEMYLYVWAREHLRISDSGILKTIKDVSILSVLAGYAITLSLPAACYLCGQLAPQWDFTPRQVACLLSGPWIVAAVLAVAMCLRKAIFFLPTRLLTFAMSVHLGRIMLFNALLVLQWMAVMPSQPYYVWCTLLALQNIVGRLPALFGKDLIFVAASVGLSQELDAPSAAITGMLLASSILEKLVNMVLFSGLSLISPDRLSVEDSAALPKAAVEPAHRQPARPHKASVLGQPALK